MTATTQPDPTVGDSLTGCPAADHLRWYIAALAPRADQLDPLTVEEHVALDDGMTAEHFAERITNRFTGGAPIVDVQRWRTTAHADPIVSYRGSDDHDYDLVASIDQASGRLRRPYCLRAVTGTDFASRAVTQLTDTERDALFAVFDTAYRHADHHYLADQLNRLDATALAYQDTRLVGFSIAGVMPIDLPVIGRRTVAMPGLYCVDPAMRRAGVASGLGSTMIFGTPRPRQAELVVSRIATPATLKGFPLDRAWPKTLQARLASYTSLSPTQRAVGHAACAWWGRRFDEDHSVCIGTGRPVGEPVIEIDAEEEFWAPFELVDRNRGDTLLDMVWNTEPPPSWYQ
jgi:hypothetical protein